MGVVKEPGARTTLVTSEYLFEPAYRYIYIYIYNLHIPTSLPLNETLADKALKSEVGLGLSENNSTLARGPVSKVAYDLAVTRRE